MTTIPRIIHENRIYLDPLVAATVVSTQDKPCLAWFIFRYLSQFFN